MKWGVSASHVPVLTLIPKLSHITKVLEIGSGELSTLLFLNKNIYPDLKELTSVEEDNEWFEKMKSLIGENDRFIYRDSIPAALYDYDLIFIDGPQWADRRAKVIKYITKHLLTSLIVIHDVENKCYRKQIDKQFNKRFEFKFVPSPMTGVYSIEPLPVDKLKRGNKIMKKNFESIDCDANKWKEIL